MVVRANYRLDAVTSAPHDAIAHFTQCAQNKRSRRSNVITTRTQLRSLRSTGILWKVRHKIYTFGSQSVNAERD